MCIFITCGLCLFLILAPCIMNIVYIYNMYISTSVRIHYYIYIYLCVYIYKWLNYRMVSHTINDYVCDV